MRAWRMKFTQKLDRTSYQIIWFPVVNVKPEHISSRHELYEMENAIQGTKGKWSTAHTKAMNLHFTAYNLPFALLWDLDQYTVGLAWTLRLFLSKYIVPLFGACTSITHIGVLRPWWYIYEGLKHLCLYFLTAFIMNYFHSENVATRLYQNSLSFQLARLAIGKVR